MHRLINADCLDYLNDTPLTWTTVFGDPPDNIGLGYQTYKDKLPDEQYVVSVAESFGMNTARSGLYKKDASLS